MDITRTSDRKIIEELRNVNDPYPYFRGLVSEVTSDVKLLPFHHQKMAELLKTIFILCMI